MSSSSREGILAVCGTLLGLSTVAIGLRFYARKAQDLKIKWDDGLVVVAYASYLGAAICIFIMVERQYLGATRSDLVNSKASNQLQITWDILGQLSLSCTKISVLFFYRRVFCIDLPFRYLEWFDVATRITIVIVVMWLVTYEFLAGFQCGVHLSALWTGEYLKYCTISFPFLYSLVISDFILDVWILSLPIPRIVRLHSTWSYRLSMIGLFLLAFIGLGACIARMVENIVIHLQGPSYYINHNIEIDLTQYFYLSMLEAGMALVATNLPTFWMFYTSMVPEGVARSIRSVRSLSSTNSEGAKVASRGLSAANVNRTNSTALSLKRDEQVKGSEAYALQDIAIAR